MAAVPVVGIFRAVLVCIAQSAARVECTDLVADFAGCTGCIVLDTGSDTAVRVAPGSTGLAARDLQVRSGNIAAVVEQIGSGGGGCRFRTACWLRSHDQQLVSGCVVGNVVLERRTACSDLDQIGFVVGPWEGNRWEFAGFEFRLAVFSVGFAGCFVSLAWIW